MLLARIDSASPSIRSIERSLLNVKQIIHEGWIDCIEISIMPDSQHRSTSKTRPCTSIRPSPSVRRTYTIRPLN
jgi:hypothetical protein